MIDGRKKKELLGIIVALMGIILLLSLISYSPSDPTLFGFSPSRLEVKNWMGLFGAHLAKILYTPFGVASFVFPLILFRFSWDIFWEHRFRPFLYISTSVLAILGISILTSLFPKEISLRGEKISCGGVVGNWVTSYMVELFSYTGTIVIVTGVGLCTAIILLPWTLQEILEGVKHLLSLCKKIFISLFQRVPFFLEKIFSPLSHPTKNFQRKESAALFQKQVEEEPPVKAKRNIQKLQEKQYKDPPLENLFASSISEPESPTSPGNTLISPSLKPNTISEPSSLKFSLPSVDLLDKYENRSDYEDDHILQKKAEVLTQKLADFGVSGEVVNILPGPVITMFEYVPAPGIKISKIVNLQNDLTMALKALSIRIVAPIPGKAAVGIEIPNTRRQLVSIRSVIESSEFQRTSDPLTVVLGKDTTGLPVVTNLAKMPHLLIAGATGTGKSVCLNAILASLLFRNTPENLRLLLIDPKRIELSFYEGIPHLIHPVVTDVKKATKALQWAVEEMERRYSLMAEYNARNIESFNKGITERVERKSGENSDVKPFPYLVIIIDELADLMMVASREVEESITRLAQMARAAGIHLVLATQRPSVDVITGLIKANIPSRISFQVSSKIDSRTILDAPGAETLLGSGDMLFLPPGTAKLQRIHGAFISDREVQRITEFWRNQAQQVGWQEEHIDFSDDTSSSEIDDSEIDEKYEEAVKLVLETRQASISMIQRRLRVGYNRAARMIELMEKQGIVGPSDGIKPREVLGLPGGKHQQSN
ncbi:MAG: DNA translocase FtsK 4TM domain-containing protein [Syntrophobacterales bacterium]|nr:DNA translocase FtsK 4TM domain-containing protein [Syntrophobacterales bacterium]